MKKTILILSLITVNHMETKAQQETQSTDASGYTAAKHTVLQVNHTFLNNTYYFTGNGPDKDYDFYKRISKNYRIAGWSTLGGGIILGVAGLLVATNNNSYSDYNSELRAERTNRVLFISSAAVGIISIPLMIMATVYGHKAKVLLKAQKTGFGVPQNVDKNIMGVTISLPIGR